MRAIFSLSGNTNKFEHISQTPNGANFCSDQDVVFLISNQEQHKKHEKLYQVSGSSFLLWVSENYKDFKRLADELTAKEVRPHYFDVCIYYILYIFVYYILYMSVYYILYMFVYYILYMFVYHILYDTRYTVY